MNISTNWQEVCQEMCHLILRRFQKKTWWYSSNLCEWFSFFQGMVIFPRIFVDSPFPYFDANFLCQPSHQFDWWDRHRRVSGKKKCRENSQIAGNLNISRVWFIYMGGKFAIPPITNLYMCGESTISPKPRWGEGYPGLILLYTYWKSSITPHVNSLIIHESR